MDGCLTESHLDFETMVLSVILNMVIGGDDMKMSGGDRSLSGPVFAFSAFFLSTILLFQNCAKEMQSKYLPSVSASNSSSTTHASPSSVNMSKVCTDLQGTIVGLSCKSSTSCNDSQKSMTTLTQFKDTATMAGLPSCEVQRVCANCCGDQRRFDTYQAVCMMPASQVAPNNSGNEVGGKIVGSELHIVTASGEQLKVDANGLTFVTSTGGHFYVHDGEFQYVTTMGRLRFAGNELSIESRVDDPSKLRLASPHGNQSAISFNDISDLTMPDRHEEFALIAGSLSEDDKASLGGQLKISVRKKNSKGDSAMSLMGVITPAYTDGIVPKIFLRDPQNNLGPFN